MNAKKVLAMTLATAMVVGSSMTVLAESSEGETAGTGSVEGYVETDVFQVSLPTETEFSFIIDPQGLIAATDAAAYTDKTFESDATLFFANTYEDGYTKQQGEYDYSSTSDTYTITNKSSVDVDVTVAATLTNYDGIEVSDSSTFDSTNPAIYLALVSGNTTTAIAESGDKASATLTGSADEAPSGAYSITYDTNSKEYSYTLDTAGEYNFDTYTFNLTGASNADADWSDLKEAAPAVSVTWTVTEHVDAIECDLQLSSGTSITSSMSVSSSGVYISIDGASVTTSDASILTSVKLNGTEVSVTKGVKNSKLYFMFPEGTNLSSGDVVTLVISGVTYTYTFAS